jgi:hypothetical protein
LEVTEEEYADPDPRCALATYRLGPGSPLGTYRVTFRQGQVRRLTGRFRAVLPAGLAGAWLDPEAWFVGLRPGERARLLVFGSDVNGDGTTYSFLAERHVEAAEGGAVLARFEPDLLDAYVVAVALITEDGRMATVKSQWPDDSANIAEAFFGRCGEALPARLAAGERATVAAEGLDLLDQPSLLGSSPLVRLSAGTAVMVLDETWCDYWDGNLFRKVETAAGEVGWVVEADATAYYLETAE